MLLAKLQLSANCGKTLPICKLAIRPVDVTCMDADVTCTDCTVARVVRTIRPHTCGLLLGWKKIDKECPETHLPK
jgi:hypothetical protein